MLDEEARLRCKRRRGLGVRGGGEDEMLEEEASLRCEAEVLEEETRLRC